MPKRKFRKTRAPKDRIVLENVSPERTDLDKEEESAFLGPVTKPQQSFDEKCQKWFLILEAMDPNIRAYQDENLRGFYKEYFYPKPQDENNIINLLKKRIEFHEAKSTHEHALKNIILIASFFLINLKQTEARSVSLISNLISAFKLLHTASIDLIWLPYLQNAELILFALGRCYHLLYNYPEYESIFPDTKKIFPEITLTFLEHIYGKLESDRYDVLEKDFVEYLNKNNDKTLLERYEVSCEEIKNKKAILTLSDVESLNEFNNMTAYFSKHPRILDNNGKLFSENFASHKARFANPDFNLQTELRSILQTIAVFLKSNIQNDAFNELVFLLVTIRQHLQKCDREDILIVLAEQLFSKMGANFITIRRNDAQIESIENNVLNDYPLLFSRWFDIAEITDLQVRRNKLSAFYEQHPDKFSVLSEEILIFLFKMFRERLEKLMAGDQNQFKWLLLYDEVMAQKFGHLSEDVDEYEYALFSGLYLLYPYLMDFKDKLNGNKPHPAFGVFLPHFLSNTLFYADIISNLTRRCLVFLKNEINPVTRHDHIQSKFYDLGYAALTVMSTMGLFLSVQGEKERVDDFYTQARNIQLFLNSSVVRQCIPYQGSPLQLKRMLTAESYFSMFKDSFNLHVLFTEGIFYFNRFQKALTEQNLSTLENENIFNNKVKYAEYYDVLARNCLAHWKDMLENGISPNFIVMADSIIAQCSGETQTRRHHLYFAELVKYIKYHYYLTGFAHFKMMPEIIEGKKEDISIEVVHEVKSEKPKKSTIKKMLKTIKAENHRAALLEKENQARIDVSAEIERIEFEEAFLKWSQQNKIREQQKKNKRERKKLRKKSDTQSAMNESAPLISSASLIETIKVSDEPKVEQVKIKDAEKNFDKKLITSQPYHIPIPKAPDVNVWEARKQEQRRKELEKYKVNGIRVEMPQDIKKFMEHFTSKNHKMYIVGSFIHYILGCSQHTLPNDIDFVTNCSEEEIILAYPGIQKSPVKNNLYTNGKYEVCSREPDFDLLDDASKRDTAETAIYLCEEGYFYDPLQGLSRLLNPKTPIALIGSPFQRIRLDPILIFRIINLSTKLDRIIELDVIKAMEQYAQKLNQLQFGEIKHHFKKLLLKSNAVINFKKLLNFKSISGTFKCYRPSFELYWNSASILDAFMLERLKRLDAASEATVPEYERVAYMFSLLLFPGLLHAASVSTINPAEHIKNILYKFVEQYPSIARKQLNRVQAYLEMHCHEYALFFENYLNQAYIEARAPSMLTLYDHRHSFKNQVPTAQVPNMMPIEREPIKKWTP